MTVWILYDYHERVEGVYTPEGKELKEQERYEQALQRRSSITEHMTAEIVELKNLRQPYIDEAEMLVSAEAEAKEANNTGLLKSVRKQRKVLLKQAEHLTYKIHCLEDKILEAQRLTKHEIMSTYGDYRCWEEHVLEGA